MTGASTQLFDLDSTVMGITVPVSVVLPPDYQSGGVSLPLLINLHGVGFDLSLLSSVSRSSNRF